MIRWNVIPIKIDFVPTLWWRLSVLYFDQMVLIFSTKKIFTDTWTLFVDVAIDLIAVNVMQVIGY